MRIYSGVILAVVFAAPLAAEETNTKTKALDTLVITATRLEEDRTSIPTIVEVVDQADDQRQGHPNRLQDQLRDISGVSVNQTNGGFGGGGYISIRGARSQQTQFLIDNVPFNDPADSQRQIGYQLFQLPSFSRIEIAKGAQSGLYGSGAGGGAVNLLTTEPTDKTQAKFRVEYGTFDTLGSTFAASGPLSQEWGFAVGGNILASSGFSPQSPLANNGDPDGYDACGFTRQALNGKMRWTHGDNTAYVSALMLKADEHFDNTGPNDIAEMNFNSRRVGTGGSFQLAPSCHLDGDAAYTTYERDYTTGYNYTGRDAFGSLRGVYEWNKTNIDDTITIGFDGRRESMTTTGVDDSNQVLGTWAQALYNDHGLQVQLVGRHDDYSSAGDAWTYRAGVGYEVWQDHIIIHAATGTGFRAPSLYEMHAPGMGNPDLRPEETKTYEIGHRSHWGDAVRFEQTAFYTRFMQGIQWAWTGPGAWDGQYQNLSPIERAYVEGVENTLVVKPTKDLQLKGTVTFQHSNDGSGENHEMTFTPKTFGGTEASYAFRAGGLAWQGLVGIDYQGKRVQDYYSSQDTLAALTTLRAAISCEISSAFRVYLRGENLTDKTEAQYKYTYNNTAATSMPRTFTFGIEATF